MKIREERGREKKAIKERRLLVHAGVAFVISEREREREREWWDLIGCGRRNAKT